MSCGEQFIYFPSFLAVPENGLKSASLADSLVFNGLSGTYIVKPEEDELADPGMAFGIVINRLLENSRQNI